jgi:hypothetical protein
MSLVNRSVLSLFLIGASTSFAGTMGPVCTEGNVTVPCEMKAWDVGMYALYLQPSADADLGYWGSYITNNEVHFNDWDAKWDWGFKLEGSYHFNTGNDININWYYFSETTNSIFTFGVSPATFQSNNSIKTKWNAVNFEFGQHINLGEHKNIRVHGGLQYANITNTAFSDNLGNFGLATGGKLEFNGIGPRTGADLSYDCGNNFEFYANAAAALLVSTSKFNLWNNITNLTTYASKNAVVPELEAKLGGKYHYAMEQGKLTVDAGWMVINYFNANHTFGGFLNGETDMSFNGPYVGFKWLGSM